MAQSCSLLTFTITLLIFTYHAAIITNVIGEIQSNTTISQNNTATTKQPSTSANGKTKAPESIPKPPKRPCPSSCTCLTDDTIDCSRRKLTAIPSFDSIPMGNIKFLNLSNNVLDKIESPQPLKNLKLEKLDLSHNNIQLVTFKKLNLKITELDLSNNRLTNLTSNLTLENSAQSIERLKLSNNLLKAIPADFFDDLGNLTSLDISSNPIRSIPEHSLESLKKLEFLNLSSLQLVELKTNQFHGVDQLKTLDLSNNQFSEVPNKALRGASDLQKLIFSSNPIKALTGQDFYLTKSLRHLEVENCTRLEKVDGEAFSDLKDIETLIISQNPNLSKIDPLAFKNNLHPPLKTVDFSSNKLSTLDQMSLKWLNIEIINLSQNPWHCDCEISWLKSLHGGSIHCASPDVYKDMEVTVYSPDCSPRPSHEGIPWDMKISLILAVLLIASLIMGSMMAIKHNSFCRRLIGREQYSSVYYTKAEFGPMDTL